jgi:hypothetical protein
MDIRNISTITENQYHQGLNNTHLNEISNKTEKVHYDCLEIDEFWTYGGKKEGPSMAYIHRGSGEMVVYGWEKGDLKTAQKLRKRIQGLGIRYERITRDDGDSFTRHLRRTIMRPGRNTREG